MKRFFSLLCLVLAVSFASAQQLPDVKVETAQGKIVSVRDLVQGKPLIIAYWSIACKPCIQELKRAMNVSLTPQSFVVDAEGNIIYSHSGYTPGSEQELFDKIVALKKKKK